jgi:branched-chain amino acid transport system permease protein
MSELLQQLINGLALGAIYALIALGYTMVYGVLRFINFAHSDVFMVGAFAGYFLARVVPGGSIGAGIVILIGAMAVCALLGVVIEKLAYRPLRGRSTLTVLITAIGVSLLLQNVGQRIFGANPRSFPSIFPVHQFHFGGIVLSSTQILVFVVTLVLLFPAALHRAAHAHRHCHARAVVQSHRGFAGGHQQ